MDEEKEAQQTQESAQGREQVKTAETAQKDPTEERIRKINEAADRFEQVERKLAERENSLREAEALSRLGGFTNAGQLKLTPEQELKEIARKEADEIYKSFK